MKKNYLLVAISLAVGIGMAGCKVTGGGTIPSASGVAGEKSNFGLTGKGCEIAYENAKGKFNYHDSNAPGFDGGVKALGDLINIVCEPGSPESCLYNGQQALYVFDFEYSSTNPNLPGDGYGTAAVIDAGEGNHVYDDGDMLYVGFTDGPFAGYTNDGPVSGNIQAHEDGCPIGIP